MELLEVLPLADLCLLAAEMLALLLLARCVLELLTGRSGARRLCDAVFATAAIFVVSVLARDATAMSRDGWLAGSEPFPGLAAIALCVIAGWLNLRFSALHLPAAQLRRHPLAWSLLATSLVITGWSTYRCQQQLSPPPSNLPPMIDRSVQMWADAEYVGISDRGREIQLYRSAAVPLSREQAYHPGKIDPRVKNTVIERGDPDTASNCHGWVFTGGEFLLDQGSIQTILADNGYEPCEQPQAGDLIIYSHGPDRAAHTGLVSGVLLDGTVIIESKWGVEGRFLHRPEDQPYGHRYQYYRSSREGHRIAVRPQPDSSVARQRPPRKRTKRPS